MSGYTPRRHYTPDELREALILDLEADLSHSERVDPPTPEWLAYRAKIRSDLASLRAGNSDPRLWQ